MTDVIRTINEIRNHNTDGYLVLIDQAKAFDRVNHQYLFSTMAHMGITAKFLQVIKEIYQNITSQITINGGKTRKVNITRGVRQGCPLSMILYTICAIPVIHMINNNKRISGHTTKKNRTIKVQCYADDSTIIIKNPNEIKEIQQIYNNHSAASESKINDDKTQIFKLGRQNNDKEEKEANIQGKIQKQVTILGAKFCTEKQKETELNLKKASNILDKLKHNTEHYLSIIGKIIKINTYVYTTIYNNAWLIDTQSKAFKIFIKKVSIYLQRVRNADVYDRVTGAKKHGGLGLVDIEERITTIKARELLEAADQTTEKDDLLYETSVKEKVITGKTSTGPKAEQIRKDIQPLITKIEKHSEEIKNYKKKRKKIRTKDLQNIIYPKEKTTASKNIFILQEPKTQAINYIIAHQLLPTHNNMKCKFCSIEPESINHLFLECSNISNIRLMMKEFLEAADSAFDKHRVLRIENITNIPEAIAISKYKELIWNTRNALMRKDEGNDYNEERTATN